MRAVLDVNVLISALLSPDGSPARVLAAWLRGDFELIVSPKLLDELERALAYAKIRTRVSEDEARELIELLALWATVLDDPHRDRGTTRDPKDAYLLALGAAAKAVVVTGDKQLLELSDRLPVATPRGFLDSLGGLRSDEG